MSDTGYTPSFERVRDRYVWAYTWRTADDLDEGETDLSRLREANRVEFDRALAVHDREVAAKALRHARQVIMQYLATSEKWRYDRVVRAFEIMLGEIPEDTPEPAALVSEPSTPEGETP